MLVRQPLKPRPFWVWHVPWQTCKIMLPEVAIKRSHALVYRENQPFTEFQCLCLCKSGLECGKNYRKIIVFPTCVIFLVNIGSDGDDTYIKNNINPGMHWTICILHRDTKTIVYGDSFGRKMSHFCGQKT